MEIIVCCKQVIDLEAPLATIKVDSSTKRVVLLPGMLPVISPFDEQAVEAALRIKDTKGATVTAIWMGNNLSRDVVKKPLFMGADELILLEDEAFLDGDSWSTAYALAMAIKKIGRYDLIFCGRQASDWDAGQVGLGIAEILGLPSVTVARKIDVLEDKARVERVTADGYQVIEVSLPALITVSNELGQPRYPKIKQIMAARRREPVVWKPADIGVVPAQIGAAGRRSELLQLQRFQEVQKSKCEIITADTPEEAGTKLALRLRESEVL